jgi:nucleotide-binding universal stress UspA family protein
MKMINDIKSIVFAVEPFAVGPLHLENIAKTIKALTLNKKAKVHALSILSANQLGWPGTFDFDSWVGKLSDRAKRNIQDQVDVVNFEQLVGIEVIEHNSHSQTQTVQCFLDTAKNLQANLLIFHARTKSLFKSAVGSFSYKLVSLSKIPMLVLPFEGSVPTVIHSILFPTDFSNLSKSAFDSVVDMAVTLKARLFLFHHVVQPIGTFYDVWPDALLQEKMLALLERNRAEKDKTAERWKSFAATKGCEVEIILDDRGARRAGCILEMAENKRVDLIALSSRLSAFSAPAFGLTVKEILRKANVPALIIPVPQDSFAGLADEI